MIRKYHKHKLQANPWHLKDSHNNHETQGRQTEQNNQLSLPHQGDCKTRMDISNVQQNKEQLQNPTMGVTINNESTTTEPPPYIRQQPKPWGGGLNAFFWYQIFTLDSTVVEAKTC